MLDIEALYCIMTSKKDVQSLNAKLNAIQEHLNRIEVNLQKINQNWTINLTMYWMNWKT